MDARAETLAFFRELTSTMLTDDAKTRKVAQRFAKRIGLTKKDTATVIAGVRALVKAHRSLSTPELKAGLMRRTEDAIAERLGIQRPAPKPSLFHGSAMFNGIAIENHGTFERPLFRLEDVAHLAKMPTEEILEGLDARDEIEARRCELTGVEEVFVTEPGLYQALMWGESPAAEAFKCRVAGVINKNPELQKKANELLADLAEESKKPRA